MKIKLCNCGSGIAAEKCCLPFIVGELIPDSAEKLMRSRYVAYSQANIPYIVATMRDTALADYDDAEAFEWAKSVKWLKLEVVDSYSLSDTQSVVEFKAYFRANNKKQCLHEISEFHHKDGRWFYIGSIDKK